MLPQDEEAEEWEENMEEGGEEDMLEEDWDQDDSDGEPQEQVGWQQHSSGTAALTATWKQISNSNSLLYQHPPTLKGTMMA